MLPHHITLYLGRHFDAISFVVIYFLGPLRWSLVADFLKNLSVGAIEQMLVSAICSIALFCWELLFPPIIFKVYSWISWALPGWKWNRVHRTNAAIVEILPSSLTRVCLACALTCLTWQVSAVKLKLLPDQEQTLLGTAKRWGDTRCSGVLNARPWIYV